MEQKIGERLEEKDMMLNDDIMLKVDVGVESNIYFIGIFSDKGDGKGLGCMINREKLLEIHSTIASILNYHPALNIKK